MKIWENKMFEFRNFGIFCFFAYLRKSNPKLNPRYVGYKFWNSNIRNDRDSATVMMFTAVVDSESLWSRFPESRLIWHFWIHQFFASNALELFNSFEVFWIQNVVNMLLTFATWNISIVEIVGIYPSGFCYQ